MVGSDRRRGRHLSTRVARSRSIAWARPRAGTSTPTSPWCSGHAGLALDGAAGACDGDDQDADVWPGADELCDGLDNDCDGETDDDPVDGNTFYADGDGEGDAGDSLTACDPPSGHVSDDGDCDDVNAAINTATIELCDPVDNDCDTYVDEELPDCAGGDSAPKLGGCGCASADGTATWWAMGLVALAARRRRR